MPSLRRPFGFLLASLRGSKEGFLSVLEVPLITLGIRDDLGVIQGRNSDH